MDIFLKGEDGFLMKLPVNPSQITVNENQKLEIIEVLNAGEVPQIGHPQLQTMEFESFFPTVKDGNYIKNGMDALSYFNRLRKWKTDQQPVRLVISELFGQAMKGGNVNQLYYITDFQYSVKHGWETDIPYKMKLVQYKKLEPRKLSIKELDNNKIVLNPPPPPAKPTPPRPPVVEPTPKPPAPKPRYHTVVWGDYLRKLSKKYYGDEMKWSTIYNANKSKIKHPDLIYVGQVLEIPYLTTENTTTVKPKTHTVKSGDTLWALAVKYYNNGNQYTKIFNANKGKITNPNIIYVGQVLTIP